jgi:hypothetical protein
MINNLSIRNKVSLFILMFIMLVFICPFTVLAESEMRRLRQDRKA